MVVASSRLPLAGWLSWHAGYACRLRCSRTRYILHICTSLLCLPAPCTSSATASAILPYICRSAPRDTVQSCQHSQWRRRQSRAAAAAAAGRWQPCPGRAGGHDAVTAACTHVAQSSSLMVPWALTGCTRRSSCGLWPCSVTDPASRHACGGAQPPVPAQLRASHRQAGAAPHRAGPSGPVVSSPRATGKHLSAVRNSHCLHKATCIASSCTI